jgi:hypothetical protein
VNALISPKSAFMQLSKAAKKVILELGTDKFERTLFLPQLCLRRLYQQQLLGEKLCRDQ